MNLIDEPTDEEYNESENLNEDFASLFYEEANEVADSQAETVVKKTTEFATWDELADQSGIDLIDSDTYSVRSVSDGEEADSFINDDSTDYYDSDDNDF